MYNFLKVKVDNFSKELKNIEYVDKTLPDEVGSTEYLYFKKMTISNLLDEQSKQIFDIKDKIAKALGEYQSQHPIKMTDEEIEELQENLKKQLEKREKMSEEEKTEEKIKTTFTTVQAYGELGINSYEIIKIFEKLQSKFIFLDPEGKIPFNKETQDQFDFEITNVYFFLLALSI